MTVIVGLHIPPHELELGHLLDELDDTCMRIDGHVRGDDGGVLLFSVADADGGFFDSVRQHPSITSVDYLDTVRGRDVYAVSWETVPDGILSELDDLDARLLGAQYGVDGMEISLSLPDESHLEEFKDRCEREGHSVEITRKFNHSRPESGSWFGLTEPQREALSLARKRGYFEIPRRCTVADLADEFGISDQAMSERLRRAVGRLVGNTMMVMEED